MGGFWESRGGLSCLEEASKAGFEPEIGAEKSFLDTDADFPARNLATKHRSNINMRFDASVDASRQQLLLGVGGSGRSPLECVFLVY